MLRQQHKFHVAKRDTQASVMEVVSLAHRWRLPLRDRSADRLEDIHENFSGS